MSLQKGAPGPAATLWTQKDFGDAEFVLDCRSAKSEGADHVGAVVVQLCGPDSKDSEIKLQPSTAESYERFVITVEGRHVSVKRDDKEIQRLTLPPDAATRGPLGLRDTGSAVEFMNIYVREL